LNGREDLGKRIIGLVVYLIEASQHRQVVENSSEGSRSTQIVRYLTWSNHLEIGYATLRQQGPKKVIVGFSLDERQILARKRKR
jgi:hypothetical protein